MNLVPITDLADPRVAHYANMRDAELAQRADPLDPRAHAGVFIAEGELVLRRLIASRFRTLSVLTTRPRLASLGDALAELDESVPVYLVDQPLMDSIVGFNMHRGVLAIGSRSNPPSINEILARSGPIVVLEDLVNHDNLGGIFRNVAALAGPNSGVILSPRCGDPLYRKSLRVSMGTVLSVPFARAEQWPLQTDDSIEVWALTPGEGAVSIETAAADASRRRVRVALLLGTEGAGLSQAAQHAAHRRVIIPMRKADPSVDSLNVAMACGIALHVVGGNG